MALSGIVETDWSPYTFTMNWRFTRRNHWVRFETGEPICFVQPILRNGLEPMDPKFVPLADNPDGARQFAEWSESRNEFRAEAMKQKPVAGSDQWQKRYYRGLDMHDMAGMPDHRAKLRLKPFVPGTASPPAARTVEVDPDRLEAAMAALAFSVRSGTEFDAIMLTDAGLSPDQAARIVRAARGVGSEPSAQYPGG